MANNDYSNAKQYTPQRAQGGPTLREMLASNLKAIQSALPKHLTPERIARVALNHISKTPQLQNCMAASLCGAIMEASSLGLEIDMRGLAYLVPYGNKAQLIIGYKGLIDLALRSGKVKQIIADVICEHDTYNVTLGLNPELEHKPCLTGRGDVIASYAIAVMTDGSKQFVIVPREDIEKVRTASKAKSGPWFEWYNQMAMKTAVKRLCKFLPLSPEIQRATALDDIADAGNEQTFDVEVGVPTSAPIQDTVATPVEAAPSAQTSQDYTFTCPKNEKKITEDVCKDCPDYKGCPQWEAV